MNAKTALAAALFCALLAGCNPSSETANNAGEPNEAIMRKSFVDSCAASAHQASENSISKEQAAELCGCGYDKVSAEYSDRAAWLQAFAEYNSNPASAKNKAFEERLVKAVESCIE